MASGIWASLVDSSARLNDVRVLVVEDEFLLADDLTRSLHAEGAVVVGPAPTVEQALNLLQGGGVDAAVLDVNLRDSVIYPVLRTLEQREIPFLLTTGYDEAVVPEQYRKAPRVSKPYDIAEVVQHLVTMLR